MKDFRDLRVWAKAHGLTLELYRITSAFPRNELYGLTSQIRRCSVSIGANIAEGCGKRGNNEFQRYLQIASGSASELDYHLLLSKDLGFLREADYRDLAKSLLEVRKMLTALLQKVEAERLLAKC
jgi:four helix bundle protein